MDHIVHKNRKVIASVQRALDILDLFKENRAELGNAEIARLAGLDPGTAAGLVNTLRLNNYLDQNPVNRKYRLGLKIAERASVLFDQLDLRTIAAPHLDELREWSGESVNLAVRDGNQVVYIERLYGAQPLGIRSELGKRAPLHSTALGKAIIASLPPQEAEALLLNYEFVPVTQNTILALLPFEIELERVRATGYAIDDEENEMGGRCVGASILNHDGYPVAAVSLSVPLPRFPPEKIPVFGGKVKETARAISNSLGHQGH